MKLEDFGLSAERGYLSTHEIDEISLPDSFDEMLDAAASLSDLITSGRVRHFRLDEARCRQQTEHAQPTAGLQGIPALIVHPVSPCLGVTALSRLPEST